MGGKRFIFDVDGTILKPDYSDEEKYFHEILNPTDAALFIPNIASLISDYEREVGKYDVELLSSYLSERSGVLITSDVVRGWREVVSCYEPKFVPDVKSALIRMHNLGHSLAVLTNWFESDQQIRLKRAGIADLFDDIYGGEQFLKPDPRSYLMAAKQFNPRDCYMVGDSFETDIVGALNVGMNAIFYNPKGKEYDEKRYVKCIKSFNEMR